MKTERDLFIPFIGKLEKGSSVIDLLVGFGFNGLCVLDIKCSGSIFDLSIRFKRNNSLFDIYTSSTFNIYPMGLVFESEEEMKVAEIAINHKANPIETVKRYRIDKDIKKSISDKIEITITSDLIKDMIESKKKES